MGVRGPTGPSFLDSFTEGSIFVNKREDMTFFDSVTQQPSIFTKPIYDYAGGYTNTTKDLTIYWNYDDIMVFIPGTDIRASYNNDDTYNSFLLF